MVKEEGEVALEEEEELFNSCNSKAKEGALRKKVRQGGGNDVMVNIGKRNALNSDHQQLPKIP